MEISITLVPETGAWNIYITAENCQTVHRTFTVYAAMVNFMTTYANSVMSEKLARLEREVARKQRALEYVRACMGGHN